MQLKFTSSATCPDTATDHTDNRHSREFLYQRTKLECISVTSNDENRCCISKNDDFA